MNTIGKVMSTAILAGAPDRYEPRPSLGPRDGFCPH